eukprot:TRINITY_DN7428_c0_g1_i1.p1 TRINITY_DN7428_c0_g1~~TRINITY_DN7428_c0_g1_i1.p1  ORF type:complete len:992 (+),score=206.37 TRINITY_DN7428_c0_g1_i1:109-3084(+)
MVLRRRTGAGASVPVDLLTAGPWAALHAALKPHCPIPPEGQDDRWPSAAQRITEMAGELARSGRLDHLDLQDLRFGDGGAAAAADWLATQCPRSSRSRCVRRRAGLTVWSLQRAGLSQDLAVTTAMLQIPAWVAHGIRSVLLHGNNVGRRGLAAFAEALGPSMGGMESIGCGRSPRADGWEEGIAAVARTAQQGAGDAPQALAVYIGALSGECVQQITRALADHSPCPPGEWAPSVELRAWADVSVWSPRIRLGSPPTWRDMCQLQEQLPQRTLAVGVLESAAETAQCAQWCREHRAACTRVAALLFGDVSRAGAVGVSEIVGAMTPTLREVRIALHTSSPEPERWAEAVALGVVRTCAQRNPPCAVTIAVECPDNPARELCALAEQLALFPVQVSRHIDLRIISPSTVSHSWTRCAWRELSVLYDAAPQRALDLSRALLPVPAEEIPKLCQWLRSRPATGVMECVAVRDNLLSGRETAELAAALPPSVRYVDLRSAGSREEDWAQGVHAVFRRLGENAHWRGAGGVNVGTLGPKEAALLCKELRQLPADGPHIDLGYRTDDEFTWADAAALRDALPLRIGLPAWPRGDAARVAEWLQGSPAARELWEVVCSPGSDPTSLQDLARALPRSVRRVDIGAAPTCPAPDLWARGAVALACALRDRGGGRLVISCVGSAAATSLVEALRTAPGPPSAAAPAGHVRLVLLHSSGLAHGPCAPLLNAPQGSLASGIQLQLPVDAPPVPRRGWPRVASLWISALLFAKLPDPERRKILHCVRHGRGQRLAIEDVDAAPAKVVAPLLEAALSTTTVMRLQLASTWGSDNPFDSMAQLLRGSPAAESCRGLRRVELVSYGDAAPQPAHVAACLRLPAASQVRLTTYAPPSALRGIADELIVMLREHHARNPSLSAVAIEARAHFLGAGPRPCPTGGVVWCTGRWHGSAMMVAKPPWQGWEWCHGRGVECVLLSLDDELRQTEPTPTDPGSGCDSASESAE